jgi:uncharacterized protein YjbI with pentapeptide repeats
VANQQHLDILKRGVKTWNQWRKEHVHIQPNLSDADLTTITAENPSPHYHQKSNFLHANFSNANLSGAELSGTHLSYADLSGANLSGTGLWYSSLERANLSGANLNGTGLRYASLERANLNGINLRDADLNGVNLSETDLSGRDFSGMKLSKASFHGANLSGANFHGANLSEVDFREANLSRANLSDATLVGANLSGANLSRADLSRTDLSERDLSGMDFSDTNLSGVNFSGANLNHANLVRANLNGADLSRTDLSGRDLSGMDLSGANLNETRLIKTDFSHANLTNCSVYGIAAWDIQLNEQTVQTNLTITPPNQPAITVDNLKIAQFIYLLLNNAEIREVIDTITSKVVLILGRFTPERKAILDALREGLRKRNYSPVLFDFDKPTSRDLTETVSILAHLARFIIVDLTNPSSAPHEVATVIPHTFVPVQPLMLDGQREYSMFDNLRRRHDWVLPTRYYTDQAHLLAMLKEQVIEPAERKVKELEKR